MFLESVQNALEARFEIAAKLGAGEQRAHVERIDHRVFEHIRHLAVVNLHRQALGDRGFADARIADIDRIVLAPAAQHVNRPLDLIVAADQRIDECPEPPCRPG